MTRSRVESLDFSSDDTIPLRGDRLSGFEQTLRGSGGFNENLRACRLLEVATIGREGASA